MWDIKKNLMIIDKSNLISKRKIKSFDKVKTQNSLEPIIGIKLNKNLKTKNLTNIFEKSELNKEILLKLLESKKVNPIWSIFTLHSI